MKTVTVATAFLISAMLLTADTSIAGSNLRIVSYNIEADTNGYTTPRLGLETVLEGIGNEPVNGTAEPIDVLALQETTSNAATVSAIVSQLNAHYGAGTYAYSPFQATQYGSASSGNGPNALVYNTRTLELIDSLPVYGTPNVNVLRQPVRYELRPVGGTAAQDFYVYVTHMKANSSGSSGSNQSKRFIEASEIRADEAALPPDARVLYVGDFNITGTQESAYTQMTGLLSQGRGIDPGDPSGSPESFELNSSIRNLLSESATDLRYRDDIQFMTPNVYGDDPASPLRYVPGSFHVFGNDGSIPVYGNVSSGANTALAGLPNRQAVLTSLTTASDHLPAVADYTINVPEPTGVIPVLTVLWAAACLRTWRVD